MDDEIGHLLGHTEETGIETDKEMEASICPWLFTINELGSAFSFDTQRVDLSCLTSLTKLSALLDSALGTHVLMHKYSLQKRNQLWATRYSTLFERFPGKRIVAVHGAGHFVGKGNIIDLLKQQGWRWEIYDYNRHAFVALSRQ